MLKEERRQQGQIGEDEAESEEENWGDFSEQCSSSYLQTGQRNDWLPLGRSSATPIRPHNTH